MKQAAIVLFAAAGLVFMAALAIAFWPDEGPATNKFEGARQVVIGLVGACVAGVLALLGGVLALIHVLGPKPEPYDDDDENTELEDDWV